MFIVGIGGLVCFFICKLWEFIKIVLLLRGLEVLGFYLFFNVLFLIWEVMFLRDFLLNC